MSSKAFTNIEQIAQGYKRLELISDRIDFNATRKYKIYMLGLGKSLGRIEAT